MNIFYLKSAGIINVAFKAIKIIIFRKILKHDFSINIGKNRFKCITWDTTATDVYIRTMFIDRGLELIPFNFNKIHNTFIDVGGHTGYYSILLSNKFRKIFIFEPSLKCFDHLKIMRKPNYFLSNSFVGNKEGFVKVYEKNDGFAYSTNENSSKFYKCELVTLDQKLNKELVSFIKIDTDYHDYEVLLGAKNIIKNKTPIILVEECSERVFKFFKNLNYNMYSMLVTDEQKPYNLTFTEILELNEKINIKMLLCIPNKIPKFKNKFFKGNMFFGYNKIQIDKYFKKIALTLEQYL
jgi:FkbM family methyltransferase